MYRHYENLDIDREDDEPSIYLIDCTILFDYASYVVKNENEFVGNKDNPYYENEVKYYEANAKLVKLLIVSNL